MDGWERLVVAKAGEWCRQRRLGQIDNPGDTRKLLCVDTRVDLGYEEEVAKFDAPHGSVGYWNGILVARWMRSRLFLKETIGK